MDCSQKNGKVNAKNTTTKSKGKRIDQTKYKSYKDCRTDYKAKMKLGRIFHDDNVNRRMKTTKRWTRDRKDLWPEKG